MHTVPITRILINREQRQRQELGNIEELAESIRRVGLITPIGLTRGLQLIAGERRLTALKSLGLKALEHGKHFIYLDEMAKDVRYLAELEENVRRLQLTWQEQCDAIARYHELRKQAEKDWSQEKTANAMGLSQAHVAKNLALATAIKKNPAIADMDRFSSAVNTVVRQNQRAAVATRDKLIYGDAEPPAPSTPKTPSAPIFCGTFQDWADDYEGIPFNFLHCDLPYGIDFDKSPGMNRESQETYRDDFAYYAKLIEDIETLPLSSNCHIMFWFSMTHYNFTYNALVEQGWSINRFPLVWHKTDNSGVIPDYRKEGRRTYETAFYGHRGDAVLQQAVANSFGCGKGFSTHPSAKPQQMLEHFFRLFVDENTRFLDPTCGGGTSLVAARTLKAGAIQGIELDPAFHAQACATWNTLPPQEIAL